MDRLNTVYRVVLENPIGVYGIILFAGLIGAVGDALLNQAAKQSEPRAFFAGLLCWNVMALLVYVLLKRELMGWSVVLLLLSNLVFAILLSWTYFKERLSFWEWVGLGLAFIAILAMELGRASRNG